MFQQLQRTIPNSTNYIFKERRKGSQLFSVNFMKNPNNFDGVLFFLFGNKYSS
ncbi:hypothetical protein PNI0076_00583 [Streptococcus pneumoniae PNI0076]|nr:hypothetical protein SPP_1867 [Streptococcus pneumoniae P1031]ELU79400.1 hypothetical protein PNI0153_01385 [Streptococcus pneumoniae PNI0153]ELU84651.1 hypothetical protein PNI0076_00583 [Streptococcus pneumoniae PNI0076]ELU91445.1 hypothetical protein PNI0446_02009 [Streptococcus pneumoniae PNI0446]EMY83502.1 hypothetical protein PNI0164_02045 [Streptococcus pneumoniae PNI0164]